MSDSLGMSVAKRPRIDSNASETSEVLGRLLELDNQLPDELIEGLSLPNLKGTESTLLNAELNSSPAPQQANTQPTSIQSQSFNSHSSGPGSAAINVYTNNQRFSGLNASGTVPSPQPTSISTSADPTPVLPSVSSTPPHSLPGNSTSSPLQAPGVMTSSTITNSYPAHTGMAGHQPIAPGMNSMQHIGPGMLGNPHAVMQSGMMHPAMRGNAVGHQHMVHMRGGMVHQHGIRQIQHGMHHHHPAAQGMNPTQIRMINMGPQRMINQQVYSHQAANQMVGMPMAGGAHTMSHGMMHMPQQQGNPQQMMRVTPQNPSVSYHNSLFDLPQRPPSDFAFGQQPPLPGHPPALQQRPPTNEMVSFGSPSAPTSSNHPSPQMPVSGAQVSMGQQQQQQIQPGQQDTLPGVTQPGGMGTPSQLQRTSPHQAQQQTPPHQTQQQQQQQQQQQIQQQIQQTPSQQVQQTSQHSPQQQQQQQQTTSEQSLQQNQLSPGQPSLPSNSPFPGQGGFPSQAFSPGGMNPAGMGQGGLPGQGQASDPEKRKLIQQQLVLLLHAHKCQRREREQQAIGEFRPCTLPHCRTMKNVLNHMTECQAGRSCTFAHCASSRQIITHWKNCQRPDCPVCLPLKHASLQHKRENQPVGMLPGPGGGGGNRVMMGPMVGAQAMLSNQQPQRPMMSGPPNPNMPSQASAQYNHLGPMLSDVGRSQMSYNPHSPAGGGMKPGLASDFYPSPAGIHPGMPPDMAQQPRIPYPIPSIQGRPTQAWHQHVNPDLRQHLVRKLVEAIYPVQDPVALQDRRVASLIQYAMKVEKAMFETATSREEYYQLLAEKIYRIRKELEERRRIKNELEKRRQLGVGVPIDQGMVNGEPILQQLNYYSQSGRGQENRYNMPLTPQSQGGVQQGLPNMNMHSPHAPLSAEVPVSGALPLPPTPINNANKMMSPPQTSQGTELQSSTGVPSVKSEITRLSSPAPGSVKNPLSRPEVLPGGKGDITLPEHPFPSVTAAPTPSVASVTAPLSEPPPPSTSLPATPIAMETTAPSNFHQKHAKIQPDPALRKVFSRDELETALRPVFDAVYHQDPESYPFRQPVDPRALGILDYFEIIRNPMDLASIDRKLTDGEYKNPWEFCKDIWLMFDNAWLYNKKTSRVYKFCTKLSEVFDQVIDGAMQSLGYCCGVKHTFNPQVLYCYGKPLCTIPRDTTFYGYQNRYVYCPRCFSEIAGDMVSVGDDPMSVTSIPKSAFKEMKNDSIDYEPMVECIHCGREMHAICTLHLNTIWPEGFQCNSCLRAKSVSRKESKFSAKRLPSTKLSTFLEDRVNNFLQLEGADAGEVTMRVVSSCDKILDTRMLMNERFQGEFPDQFPYRTKALFAFEEIDGVEVCFFGMHVQEYGSDCQAPNTRRVYISYLDSVHFFRPRHLRTLVYHEILIGYLEFCKNNGYLTAHIWACPPSEGDDYIFHCHPQDMKIPKPKRLIDWYRKMLDRGKSDKVVYDYRDIYKHCTEDNITSVTEIPYFEGDFWPNVVEETIKELDQEAKEREASEQCTSDVRGVKKAGKRSANKKGSKKASGARSKTSKKSNLLTYGGDDLSQKIYTTMEKHKEVFFVVLLQPPQTVGSSPLPGTTDPDQLITCDLMDGRDAFLTMARERHWEFSSLRRAKYSTMAMLYELHNQSGDRFVYTCDHCRMHVETRYHCRECDDYDLCVHCYKDLGHVHTMDKLGLGLDDDLQSQDQKEQDPRAQRRASIEKCIQFLVHASQCRDPNCKLPSCIKMKRVLRHTRDCKLRMSGNCTVCKQFLLLCYSHAKTCKEDKCPVPVCARIKKNLREQRMQARMRQTRFMQQRMANMHQFSSNSNGQNGSTISSHTSPNGTSSPSKGSPVAFPSNSNPIAVAQSPLPPRSVGKGGPKTPGDPHTPQQQSSRLVAASPSSLQQAAGGATNRTEQAIPAPNVTVTQPSVLPGEMPITRVPHPGSQEQQRLLGALNSHDPLENQRAMNYMKQHPEVGGQVLAMAKEQKEHDMMSIPPDILPHQPLHSVQPQPMVRIQQPMSPYPMGHQHQQMMRPGIPQQVYHQQYRMAQMQQQPVQRIAAHQVYHHQGIPPQQHHPSQLQQMLSTRQPAYSSPPNAYAAQMGTHPHALGPPPQYPSSVRTPIGPQTAGYPQVLGQQRMMPTHSPMAQHMSPAMQHHVQYGHMQQRGIPMDPSMQSDPSFMYHHQPQYGLNSSNNNNTMRLTPQDQLSRFVDNL